jgi:hypothetical protein
MAGPNVVVTAASTRLVASGDSVVSSVTITNTGDGVAGISWDDCGRDSPPSVKAYALGDSTAIAWDSTRQEYGACFTALVFGALTPGQSKTFEQSTAVSLILGDSLPSGTYRFAVSAALITPSLPGEIQTSALGLQR